ncbi:GNAT family N-acetyltransferase [Actinoalloteichus caeruleus]|uniref:GNAT family N-acetyltransferase n=1 Tax=Actinoalloteichus cyanogriseus TaxID=2893586 RepID=UPI003BB90229
MIEVIPARDFGAEHRRAVTEVYVDAFGADFTYFSKDPKRLAALFEPMMAPEHFHLAVVDGQPAGITALTDGRQQSVRPDRRQFVRQLGLVKGTIGAAVLSREFGKTLDLPADTASLEYVGTAAAHQGKGVATALLTHLMRVSGHRRYVLEYIADTNVAALRLYRKLGFVEYQRIPVKHTRFSGINHYVSMEWERR